MIKPIEDEKKIRIRACLAVVEEDKILLVPHYDTDSGPVQWVIPGGRVDYGESLETAALREFQEETGLQATITGLLDVSEAIRPEKPWQQHQHYLYRQGQGWYPCA